LIYDGRTYRAVMRRRLVNNGTDPITRYMIRISVDRFPGDRTCPTSCTATGR